jgi:hypothetical protein
VALVAAMAALLLIAYNASPAHAAGDCSTTSGTATCTFGPTGSEDTFVVPEGVGIIHVVATGAPGAVGRGGASAGRGATVSGDLAVSPGQMLYVNVGGKPTGGGSCFPSVACNGGFNGGGGGGGSGGGGGGASDVRTVSRSGEPLETLESRLIVAGGGGGGGEGANCTDVVSSRDLVGGAGGNAGSDGGNGPTCDNIAGGGGGQAGGLFAGTGGSPDGQDGLIGQGGDGGAGVGAAGGGGGGGDFGGGGGGMGGFDLPIISPAGGGGGGSNLVPQGGSATLAKDTTVDPSVTISYQVGLGEEPPTEEPANKQACKKGGWKQFGFENQGRCIKAANHAS